MFLLLVGTERPPKLFPLSLLLLLACWTTKNEGRKEHLSLSLSNSVWVQEIYLADYKLSLIQGDPVVLCYSYFKDHSY